MTKEDQFDNLKEEGYITFTPEITIVHQVLKLTSSHSSP
jgi:hypothetical protein